MCSSANKILGYNVKTGAICVAVYKVIFMFISLILSVVWADKYEEIPEDFNEQQARIRRVLRGALIAGAILWILLMMFHLMLLWAIIKRKTNPIKWWIRVMVVVEVLTCSAMFVTKWDTLRSFFLVLNFVLNIFLLRVICAYQRTLQSEPKVSPLVEDADEETKPSSEEPL